MSSEKKRRDDIVTETKCSEMQSSIAGRYCSARQLLSWQRAALGGDARDEIGDRLFRGG